MKRPFKKRESNLISTLLADRHSIITGGTGTGKTMLLSKVLARVRRYPAVIVDPLGEHLSRFCQPGDRILDPLDSRSEYWTPWADITEPRHFAEIARLLVPGEQNGPPDNVKAARIMLAVGLEKTSTRSVKYLFLTLQAMVKTGLPELDGFAEAARRISPDLTPAMMAYVTLLASVKCLKSLWLPDMEPEFSVREWAQAPAGWLFITNPPYPDLSPLVLTWLEVLTSELLYQEAGGRRIFIVIDGLSEFAAYARLASGAGAGRTSRFDLPHGISDNC